MKLNPKNVPEALEPLLPVAELWGIEDDFEREEALENANQDDLERLVHSIDEIDDGDLYGWLAGDLVDCESPSDEYIALTCLTMAIDSAKIKLSKMS